MHKATAIIFKTSFRPFLILFFAVNALMLFIGDGKQHSIEVLVVSFTISAFIASIVYLKPKRHVPYGIQFYWAFLLFYLSVRSLFSIDIGYSVSVLVRYVSAFVLFTIFFTYSERNHIKEYIIGVLVFTVLALVTSLFISAVPSLALFIPQMNLLYTAHGHNQLANLLLFALPLALSYTGKKHITGSILVSVIFILAFIYTHSRGAIVLSSIFCIYHFWSIRASLRKRAHVFIGFLLIGILLLLSVIFLTFLNPKNIFPTTTTLPLFFNKSAVAQDNRIHYWHQSLRAFQTNPLFGHGPGTFSILSRTFQTSRNRYSWFAHNFFLERLAEIGIVGTFIVILLFYHLIKRASAAIPQIQSSTDRTLSYGLFASVGISAVYSLFEFNTEFLTMWLLLWTSAAILILGTGKTKIFPLQKPIMVVCIGFLSIFYFTSILTLMPRQNNADDNNSLIPPGNFLNEQFTVSHIDKYTKDKKQLPGGHASIIRSLHAKNPSIHFVFSKYFKATGDESEYQNHLYQAVMLDPHNEIYVNTFFDFLDTVDSPGLIGENIALLSKAALYPSVWENNLISKEDYAEIGSMFKQIRINDFHFSNYHRLYYFLGLEALKTNPLLTKRLWNLAVNVYPDLGHLHIELASLLLYTFQDYLEASRVLQQCKQHESPAKQCELYEDLHLPDTGFYKDVVF